MISTLGTAGSSAGRQSTRLAGLDELRGLAALLVLIMHLIQAVATDSFGQVIGAGGVSGFFLLTGFLMPYLLVEKYQTYKNSSQLFMTKRLIRLTPPYLVAASIVASYQVVRGHISAGEQLEFGTIFCHLSYSCGLLKMRWYGEIFWTLAIEFQYYIFAATVMMAIGILSKSNRILVVAGIAVVLVVLQIVLQSSALEQETLKDWMPNYAVRFAIGLACYGLYKNLRPFLLWPALVGLICLDWQHMVHGVTISLFSLCLIIQTENRNAAFKWLGKVSYSLYLTHGLFGVVAAKAVILFIKFPGAEVLAIFFGIAVSLIVAQMFWRLVEKPSQQWSDAVKGEKLQTP